MSQLINENHLEKVVSVIHKLPTELTPQDVGGAKVSQWWWTRHLWMYVRTPTPPPLHPHLTHQFDVIVGEPFFSVSLLPWHNLMFWYAATNCRVLLSEGGRVAPCAAELKAVAGL